jgi:putative acetyltransferase
MIGKLDIREAAAGDLPAIRNLWSEYWTSLGLAADFQGFTEELRGLPGDYTPPRGVILLASADGEPAGAIALRPLSGRTCEAKRLYVRPVFRGRNIGRALLENVIARARSMGYEELFGDTLPSMSKALELYAILGFQRAGPYSPSPTPGAIYLRLPLRATGVA